MMEGDSQIEEHNLLLDEQPATGVVLSSTFDISSIPVDEEDANKDLYVKVSDPEQVGEGVSGYVTYLVSVETALPGFEPKFQVRRRFADFQWLHTELVRQHPGYLVPPMPEAAVLQKFVGKFEAQLMAYRARELQRFLRRVAIHPVLRNSLDLNAFLSTNDADLQEKKKSVGSGAKAASSIGSMFSAVRKSVVSSVPALVGGPVEEVDDFFRQKRAYVDALGTAIVSAASTLHSLVEGERALKQQLALSTEAASVMARAESFDEVGASQQKQWRSAAKALTDQFNALSEEIVSAQVEMEDVLHDYNRYNQLLVAAFQYRWDKLVEMTSARRSLESKRAAAKQKQGDIEAAEALLNETTATYERASSVLREEIARFESTKAREISKALKRYGAVQIAYHLKVADAFRDLAGM